ncbi:MAG: hypothetical protein AAFP19_21180 [Bacteroidota bacterium]
MTIHQKIETLLGQYQQYLLDKQALNQINERLDEILKQINKLHNYTNGHMRNLERVESKVFGLFLGKKRVQQRANAIRNEYYDDVLELNYLEELLQLLPREQTTLQKQMEAHEGIIDQVLDLLLSHMEELFPTASSQSEIRAFSEQLNEQQQLINEMTKVSRLIEEAKDRLLSISALLAIEVRKEVMKRPPHGFLGEQQRKLVRSPGKLHEQLKRLTIDLRYLIDKLMDLHDTDIRLDQKTLQLSQQMIRFCNRYLSDNSFLYRQSNSALTDMSRQLEHLHEVGQAMDRQKAKVKQKLMDSKEAFITHFSNAYTKNLLD